MWSLTVSTNAWAREQWKDFVNRFNQDRFFVNEEHEVLKMIDELLKTPYKLDMNKIYFRARINDEKGRLFSDDEMAAPPVSKVGNGRLNPKGISRLYFSEREYTAIAEMRPWITSEVSVANCTPKYELNVIDFVPTPSEKGKIHSFRVVLSEEFSKPVNPYMSDIEYLPTQCIAEYIKNRGYAGIRYSSAVDPKGINYCLFDPKSMEIKASHFKEVTSVEYGGIE